MYTISKTPSKIFTKTRRGLSQNYEKFDTIKEIGRKPDQSTNSVEEYSVPRPVFQTSKRMVTHSRYETDEGTLSPQHQEIVKYINDSWNMIVAQNPYDNPSSSSDRNTRCSPSNSSSASLYCVEPPSPVLSDFKPFDLESWWGRRLFNNITKSL